MASTTPPDTPALLRPGLDFLPDDYGKFSAKYPNTMPNTI